MKWKCSIGFFIVIALISSLLVISPAGAQVRARHIGELLEQSELKMKALEDAENDLILSKSADIIDRGNLNVVTGRYLNWYVRGWGDLGRFDPVNRVGYWGYIYGFYPMVGVPPGPWGKDILTQNSKIPVDRSMYYNVLEPFSYSWGRLYASLNSSTFSDWDARDASFGYAMGTTYVESSMPAIARSIIEETWPEGYYGSDPSVFAGTGMWNETTGQKHWPGKWSRDPLTGEPVSGLFTSTLDAYFAFDDKRACTRTNDNTNVGYPVGFDWEVMVYSYSSPLISHIIFYDADIIFQKADHVAEYDIDRKVYGGSVDSVYVGFSSFNYIPTNTTVGTSSYTARPVRSDMYAYLDQPNNLLLTYHRWGKGIETSSSSYPLIALNVPVPIYGFYWAKTPKNLGITSFHYFNINSIDSYLDNGEQEERFFYAMLSGKGDIIKPDEQGTITNKFFHPFPKTGETPNYAIDSIDSMEIWTEYSLDTRQPYDDPSQFLNGVPQSAQDYGTNVDNKPDMSTMVGSGPFTFFPGDTIKVAWAHFFDDDNGINSPIDPLTGWPSNDPLRYPELRPTRNTFNSRFYNSYITLAKVKELYANYYMGSGPPLSPTLTANGTLTLDEDLFPLYLAEDGRITLYWDNIAEIIPDFGTKQYDFEGYRLYKRLYDRRLTTKWDIISQWDLKNNVQGWDSIGIQKYFQGKTSTNLLSTSTTLPPQSLWLGINTGIVHTYTESGLRNGLRYEYSLTAYDRPDLTLNIQSSESMIGSNPKFRGYVRVAPSFKPMGFVEGNIESDAQNIRFHHTSGYATAKISYRVVDELLVGDKQYTLTFTDSLGKKYYKIFNNTDNIYQVGNKVLVYDSTASPSGTLFDYWPIFNGIGLYILNHNALRQLKKGWAPITTADITARRSKIPPQQLYTWSFADLSTSASGITPTPIILEFRYGGHQRTSDTTIVFNAVDTTLSMITKKKVTDPAKIITFPFTIWNVTDSLKPYQMLITQQTAPENAPPYNLGEEISVVDSVGKLYPPRWKVKISSPFVVGAYKSRTARDSLGVVRYDSLFYTKKDSIDAYPVTGDKYRWYSTAPIVSGQDVYTFNTKRYYVDPKKFQLWKIRAVPNPYIVASGLEVYSGTSSILNKEIRFVNLPEECTIDIYTIDGDKIRRINHWSYVGGFTIKDQNRYPSGVGEARWDLLTDENLEVSYGIYVYVVKTPDGKKFIGKLLIIK